MRKFMPVVIACCLLAVGAGTPGASAQEDSNPSATASVASTKYVPPAKRRVVRRTFKPWARPTPRQVRRIIAMEARRWGIDGSRLARRIACESRFQWNAFSGTYHGLLQFAPSTFYRGVSSIRSRRVRLVRSDVRKVRGARVVRYTDGRTERRPGPRRRQRVVYVYRGTLPRRPGVTHAWTQVRIGAQAIRGISAVRSSEWGCPA